MSTHAADSSHKLFYIASLKLVASEHGLHLAGNRSGEGNNQQVSLAQRHKTQHKKQHSLDFFSATYCRLQKTLHGSKRGRKGQRVRWTNSKRSDMFVAKWPRPRRRDRFPALFFLKISLFGCKYEDVTPTSCNLDHVQTIDLGVPYIDPSSNLWPQSVCVIGLRKTTFWHLSPRLVRDRWHAWRGERYRFQ